MKKNFVEWNYKIINPKQHSENTENDYNFKITQKTKKRIESLVKSYNQNKLVAWVPTILIWWMFLACFFYPGIDIDEVLKSWPVLLTGPFLTVFWLCIVFYKERIYKRLYQQVCDWTIIIKQLKITSFRRYGSWNNQYERNKHGYRVIASDWNKEYKSIKYSDAYLWLYYNSVTYANNDELKIDGKIYHIWDKIMVYIDYKDENNYYLDI